MTSVSCSYLRSLSRPAPSSLWMLGVMGTLEEEEVRPLCPYILEERRLPRLPEGLVVATMRLLAEQDTAGEEEAVSRDIPAARGVQTERTGSTRHSAVTEEGAAD